MSVTNTPSSREQKLIGKISTWRTENLHGIWLSHVAVGNNMAPGLELLTYWFLETYMSNHISIVVNLILQGKICFLRGQRKDSAVLSSLRRKAGIMKLTDVKLRPKMGSGQAGRQEDRRAGKDCRASENGKLPGLYNQLGTFDQPEPRHQLLWDNRQPSEAWRAAGTVGTTGQWPAGKGLVNKAHRAKSRRCPSLKCCMKAAKRTSSTVKQLFPSCRLSTVALSQARHPSPQTARWRRNGAMVGSVWTCYCTCFGFLTVIPSPLQWNIRNIRNKCAHTCCSNTWPYNSVVNKTLQCSRQHLLHGDATHRKHGPLRPSPLITPTYSGKGLTTCSWLTLHYLRGMWTDKAK